MKKVKEGMICTLSKSKLGKDNEKVYYVRADKRVKFKFFKKSIWNVVDINSGNNFLIEEKLLIPGIIPVCDNGIVMPAFNSNDIDILIKLCHIIVEYDDHMDDSDFYRYMALIEKIKFYAVNT